MTTAKQRVSKKTVININY